MASLRVLIVKIGGVTELVHTMPMLGAIHEADKNAHISWLVGESCADLLRAHPRIQKLFVVNDSHLYGSGIMDRLSIVKDVFGKLDRGYDLILIGHLDPGYSLALRPFVWGPLFQVSNEDTTSQVRNVVYIPPGTMHESMAMRKLLGAGLKHAKKSIKYTWVEPFVHIGSAALRYPVDYALLHLTGDAKTKKEVSPLMFEVVSWILRETKLPLVIVGGKEDQKPVDKGLRMLTDIDGGRIFNLTGETSLRENVGLIRKAKLFIGPDTGLLHVADNFGIRTVGLYGATVPIEKGLLNLNSRGVPNPNIESVKKHALELLRQEDPAEGLGGLPL